MTDQPTRLDAALAALAVGPLRPITIPQRPNYEGHRGFRKIDPHEAKLSQCRPVEDRAPVPEVGDRIRYRHHMDEDPVPAVVLELLDRGRGEDPNPQLRLKVGLRYGSGLLEARTREARVAGGAGWLPWSS